MKEKTKSWMEYAFKDLSAAQELLNRDDLFNIVVFHSQQAIEKLFKAVLEENDLPVPKIHSVLKLYSLMTEKIHIDPFVTDTELNKIDDIFIDTRYPGGSGLLPGGMPGEEEAKEILSIAEKAYSNIKDILK
jgi:HEPN domain-containing protein